MELESVSRIAGRSAGALTRRDVARALLTEPAGAALAGLPGLRRDLFAAGNPQSATFWDSVTATLPSIQHGTVTVGEVASWLGSTGTEPLDLPELGFFWADEGEVGPVATDLHAQLVSHLESLVTDGTIDPDALVIGDTVAIAAHRQHQVEWLNTPLPDGRVPLEVIIMEEDDAFLALWDEAERDAGEILGGLLDELGDLPEDDATLWLTLAAGVVAQQDEPPREEYDVEILSAWSALGHADWIAAAVTVAYGGPGYEVDVDDLAAHIVEFDFEATEGQDLTAEDEGWDDGDLDDGAAAEVVGLGLFPVLRLWRQLGALDRDDRLTELGWWGIPESLRRAWQPALPGEPDSRTS